MGPRMSRTYVQQGLWDTLIWSSPSWEYLVEFTAKPSNETRG